MYGKRHHLPEWYESFSRLMLEDRLYLYPEVSFADVCSAIAADEKELDEMLRDTLGVGGDELMESFRRSDVENLLLLRI